MENKQLTLGSLFDGSGGFPLGGLLSGITPVWSSEIEPFPIRVTTKRLPAVKHYGDVSALNGAQMEPVDIITFGSPCQDMSIAGKRAGLDGSRSNLFYEAVRIVKEMRCATNGKYPRFIVWENVPGAFSSNGGDDFKAVLEAVCSVKGGEVPIARPEKWADAGEILADDFSVAWRVLDAQYWGVPQRRKRIYLVADFDGGCAGKILFESEGLSGYSAQGFRAWQDFARNAGKGAQAAGLCLNDQGGSRMNVTEDVACTLRAEAHHPPCVMESAGFCTEHSAKARGIGFEEEKSPTLRAGVVPAAMMFENHSQDSRYTGPLSVAQTVAAKYGTGGNNQPFVVETPKTLKIRSGCEGGGKGALVQDNLSATLATNNDQTLFVPQSCAWDGGQVSGTLTMHNACGSQRMPDKDNFNCVLTPEQKAYGICSKSSHAMLSDNPKSGFYEAETSRTLDCNGGNPTCAQGGIAVVAVQGSMIGRDDKNGLQGDGINEDVSFTLNTVDRHAIAYGIDRATYNMGQNAQFNISVQEEVEPTLVAKGPGAVAHPTDDEIRRLFLSAANKLLTDKESVVADAREMAALLFDTAALEAERDELLQETQVVSDMVQNCIYENAHVALDQAEYQKRFDGLTARFDKAKARLEAVMDEIQERQSKRADTEAFIKAFEALPQQLTEFTTESWLGLIDYATVYSADNVVFTFKNGQEIKA